VIDWLVPRASSYAGDVDGLILLIAILVGFWFLVAQGVFFFFIFRFRHREGVKAQYITGEEKREKRWVNIPHLLVLICDIVIIIGAVRVWVEIKQTLPEPDETVGVIAQQWAWTFVHPGPDGQLDTDDDITTTDELHVTLNDVYHFRLESRDVLHSFSVPAFRLKQDAVPGRQITGWFKPTRTGTFEIQCAEICGIGHGLMPARVVIETPEQHAAWIAAHTPTSLADAR
jgi:cytochrome c oxidase subunit 2